MKWQESYSSTWRIFRVNRDTWMDAESIGNVDSVSIARTADGSLLESGNITITGDFETDYYRIAMTAEQGGDVRRIDIATLLFISTGGEYNHGVNVYDVNGYSVLQPAAVTAVTIGEYAPAGVDGAKYAAELLASAINAPVEVECGFVLNDHVVHEFGSTILEAVWAVLDAGGYIIQIDGRGIVHIRPKPEEPSFTITNANRGLLENGIKFESDTSEVPNRYVVIDGTIITIATNDDPNSPISTVCRGYTVDYIDTSPTPINGETQGEYANRMLKKMSVQEETRSYSREYTEDATLYSMVRASITGLSGDFYIDKQDITCSNGVKVSETIKREIPLW